MNVIALVLLLFVLLLALVVVALVVGVLALRRTSETARRRTRHDADAVPSDLEGLRREVQALRADSLAAKRRLAVVRYDAFGDMGGRLSWSMALLDDDGNGVVLTAIHGRNDARTYAKDIAAWTCDQALSPEEKGVVAQAHAA